MHVTPWDSPREIEFHAQNRPFEQTLQVKDDGYAEIADAIILTHVPDAGDFAVEIREPCGKNAWSEVPSSYLPWREPSGSGRTAEG